MARRGKCRCGAILTFRKSDQGYKTRCPGCKSLVRLRPSVAAPAGKPSAVAAREPEPVAPAPFDLAAFQEASMSAGEAPDFSSLPRTESDAPPALAEMRVLRPQKSSLSGWLFAAAAFAVLAGVGVAVAVWG